jgi:mannose-6-phosphate isomerase-like protein (cupin superfamily)
MFRAGDTIENPVTGERLTFIRTAHETAGEVTVVQVTVQPAGFVAAAHVHPRQQEVFSIVAGRMTARLDGKIVELGPGEVVTIEAGVGHKFWNAGNEDLVFIAEVRPSLEWESLIETMYSLAAAGKTNKKGMPNPFRLAVIARAHFDVVQLPVVPAWMQKTALAFGSPLGKALGYCPTYLHASDGLYGPGAQVLAMGAMAIPRQDAVAS